MTHIPQQTDAHAISQNTLRGRARSWQRDAQQSFASRLGRGDRSQLAIWFWELDRVLLAIVLMLVTAGLIAVAAASPVAVEDIDGGGNPLKYFYTQLVFAVAGLGGMLVLSMLPKREARRLSVLLFIGAMVSMFLVFLPVIGHSVNGAQRWINLGFTTLQPSEFLKPLFVVTTAWILSFKAKDAGLPVISLSIILLGIIVTLLMMQPNLGSSIVFCGIWFAMILMLGLSIRLIAGVMALGIGGLVAAYIFYPVATLRLDMWLFGGQQNNQSDIALRTLTSGGFVGVGPGMGTRKFGLPEAHTDYIFSVIGEEFGLFACICIALLFVALIVRVCLRLLEEKDLFTMLAVTGIVAQLGGQAIINMAVNLQLFPPKGMTLPFVSYGGSSMLASCLAMGLLLAFTRRNPYLDRPGIGDGMGNGSGRGLANGLASGWRAP